MGRKVTNQPDSPGSAPERDTRQVQRAKRIRILDDETNRLREAAGDRARSVDAKSSFLAVTAGVILTAAFTRTDGASEYWLRLVPILFAVLAIAAAAIALRPAARREVAPDWLFSQWADSEQSLAQVEQDILGQKIRAYQEREKDIASRARVTSIGFVLLLLSSVALLTSYS